MLKVPCYVRFYWINIEANLCVRSRLRQESFLHKSKSSLWPVQVGQQG